MPQLKAIEQSAFGGVDSRSNAIVMPNNRFLRLRNWVPRMDGHLELRDGYVELDMSHDPGAGLTASAVHSIYPYLVATPQRAGTPPMPSDSPTPPTPAFANGDECVFFWRGTTPYLRRVSDGHTAVPPIDGSPIASSTRWHYALGKSGYLYMHNGTDMKFFDGVKLRDIGLPMPSIGQLAAIDVQAGLTEPTVAQCDRATYTFPDQSPPPPPSLRSPPYPGQMHIVFFHPATNTVAGSPEPLSGHDYPCDFPEAYPPVGYLGGPGKFLQINDLPVCISDTTALTLLTFGTNAPFAPAGLPATQAYLRQAPVYADGVSMDGGTGVSTTVTVTSPAHGLSTTTMPGGNVITLRLKSVLGVPHVGVVAWSSNGPFSITVVDTDHFTFQAPDAPAYTTGNINYDVLLTLPNGTTTFTLTTDDQGHPNPATTLLLGTETNSAGGVLLPDPASGYGLIPASAIGGNQPGYQFYVSVYNPKTGHVGNRVAIGQRIDNGVPSTFAITGLPNLGAPGGFDGIQILCWGNGTEDWLNLYTGVSKQGAVVGFAHSPGSSEWVLLLGRTGDGGEVPYAITDSNGNWVYVPAGQTEFTVSESTIDGNSELPTENYVPPPFVSFWREGDRQCGTIVNQPFVFRSGSEVDATTGIFVGDPAQAWSPARTETFPTGQAVLGGFGFMQESWVFSKSDSGQLSELSGEVAWNGPYNFGIAGPYAFDKGWKSLPFWVSQGKELCTMLPSSDGPMSISTEYEAALLARIDGGHLAETEVVYFRDPERLIEVLRIKCVEQKTDPSNGRIYYSPFVVIHDFNLRDDASPYGQGYEDIYASNSALGPPPLPISVTDLTTDFTQAWVRDADGHARVWAGGENGNLYQFYTGGDDNGNEFTADGINLRYMGGEHVAVKTLEWYGDQNILWYIYENMLTVVDDSTQWVNLTYEMRPVPGDANNGHFMADLQRPEMTHCYLWMQLTSHPVDAADPTNPMALSVPPHMPLETYGRLFLAAPILGDARGR